MTHRLLSHFTYNSIRTEAPEVVDPYASLAFKINDLLDEGPEKEMALQKLLESCDAAVRARNNDIVNRRHDEALASVAAAMGRSIPELPKIPLQQVRSD